MKRLITFDSYEASSYDVLDALYPLRSAPGVKSLEVLSAVEGSPKYCVVVDLDDEQDAAVMARMDGLAREYAGYHSNMKSRAFRKVG